MSTRSGPDAVRGGWEVALALAVAAVAAWSNSFVVPFLLDDGPAIVHNASIRRLDRIGDVLWPALGGGVTSAGRPLVNLSLALNHAIGGTAVAGYHGFNLAVHLAAALALFGLLRRTIELRESSPRWRSEPRSAAPFAGARSHGRQIPSLGARSHQGWGVRPAT